MSTEKPHVPRGLRELLLDLTEKVVLAKPVNIYLFCAKYLETLLLDRDAAEAENMPPAIQGERAASAEDDSCATSSQSIAAESAIFKLTSNPVIDVLSAIVTTSSSTREDRELQRAAFQQLNVTNTYSVISSNSSGLEVSSYKLVESAYHTISNDADTNGGASNHMHRIHPQLDDNEFSRIVPSWHDQVSHKFVPSPPRGKPPARPLCGWTALQLSRLAGRRRLRTLKITPDSLRAVPAPIPLDSRFGSPAANDKRQPARLAGDKDGGRVTKSKTAVAIDLGRSDAFDVQSDGESDPYLEWWLDDVEPKYVRNVRRRRKQPRTNKHGGRWCPPKRPEMVYSFDSFSGKHLRALVYADVF